MRFFGDGELLMLLDGQNLQYLCRYGQPSFLGISTSLSLTTRCEHRVCYGQSPRLSAYDGNVTLTDAVTDGCFVRHVESTKALDFQFVFPGYCRVYPYPDLKYQNHPVPALLVRIPAGVPSPDGGLCQSECRLMIALLGDGCFFTDHSGVHIRPGRCTLLFATAHPARLAERTTQHLAALEAPCFRQSPFFKQALRGNHILYDDLTSALATLTATGGGVLSGHGENCVYTADLAIIGSALLHTGQKNEAVKLAQFLLNTYRRHGYLPQRTNAASPFWGCEKNEGEGANYPAICLFFHHLIESGLSSSLENELKRVIRRLMTVSFDATVAGELGFSGFEFPMRQGMLGREKLLYGNALATAELLLLCKLYPSKRGDAVWEQALSHLKTDFGFEKPKVADIHRLGRFRLPHTVYGTCPACGEIAYTGWLTRSQFGSYLCPGCYGKGMREWVSTKEDPPLYGSYARYLYLLYKAQILDRRQFCRTLAGTLADALSHEHTPSLYDHALLCAVLEQVGAPEYPAAKEQLAQMIQHRSRFPLYAAEIAACLLAYTA